MSVFSIRLFLAIIIFYLVYGMWISNDNLQELVLHFTVEVSRTELGPSSSEVRFFPCQAILPAQL